MTTPEKIADKVAQERAAWPGGYALYAITDDGGVLCYECCANERELIEKSYPGDGWHVVAMASTEADDEMVVCDHCARLIFDPAE